MATKKYVIGFLIFIITLATVTVIFQGKAQIKVEKTRTIFQVNESGVWTTTGIEYNKLFNGTKVVTQKSANVTYKPKRIERKAIFGDPYIFDSYDFNPDSPDITDFPLAHTIQIYNSKNLIYEYRVTNLIYSGPSKIISGNSMSFGKNMKVTWDSGYSSATISSTGTLKIRYKILSNYQIINVKLFDPDFEGMVMNSSVFFNDARGWTGNDQRNNTFGTLEETTDGSGDMVSPNITCKNVSLTNVSGWYTWQVKVGPNNGTNNKLWAKTSCGSRTGSVRINVERQGTGQMAFKVDTGGFSKTCDFDAFANATANITLNKAAGLVRVCTDQCSGCSSWESVTVPDGDCVSVDITTLGLLNGATQPFRLFNSTIRAINETTNCFADPTQTTTENGALTVNLLPPTDRNMNVTQNGFFNMSVNVSCLGGVCGNVSVFLDPVLNPSSPGLSANQNYTLTLKNLSDNFRRWDGNVTFLANNGSKDFIFTQWYGNGDHVCTNLPADLRTCNNPMGSESSTSFCSVTDEASQIMLIDALGSQNNSIFQGHINTIKSLLLIKLASEGPINLTEWTFGVQKIGSDWHVNLTQVNDTASDADAHFIVGLAVINNSVYANSSTKREAGDLVRHMCTAFYNRNFLPVSYYNDITGFNITSVPCGGTNVCTAISSSELTYTGYMGPILEALAACRTNFGGDTTSINWSKRAIDTSQAHLIASNWTGVNFSIGHGRSYHYRNNGSGYLKAVCDNNCAGSTSSPTTSITEYPDAARVTRLCHGAYVWKNISGVELPNMTNYCQQWHLKSGEDGNEHVIERRFDGQPDDAADGGYKSMGLGLGMNALVNESLADDRLTQYFSHINFAQSPNGYRAHMDSEACMGVYGKAFGIIELGFLIGAADAAFRNVSSGTTADVTGAPTFSARQPSNASSVPTSFIQFNVTITLRSNNTNYTQLWHNGSGTWKVNQTMNWSSGVKTSFNVTEFATSQFIIWNVCANNSIGNYSCDSNFTLALAQSSGENTTKGLIPMNSGSPFYTINQNPQNNTCTHNMANTSYCIISWIVNATGANLTNWTFFAYANSANTSQAFSRSINLSILSNTTNVGSAESIAANCTFFNETFQSDASWNLSNGATINGGMLIINDSVSTDQFATFKNSTKLNIGFGYNFCYSYKYKIWRTVANRIGAVHSYNFSNPGPFSRSHDIGTDGSNNTYISGRGDGFPFTVTVGPADNNWHLYESCYYTAGFVTSSIDGVNYTNYSLYTVAPAEGNLTWLIFGFDSNSLPIYIANLSARNTSCVQSVLPVDNSTFLILLNGSNASRVYEFNQTLINKDWGIEADLISTPTITTAWLDFGDYINWTVVTTPSTIRFNISELNQTKFTTGNTSANLTSGQKVAVKMDNLTDVKAFYFKIRGYISGNYPANLTIDVDNDSRADFSIPGLIKENYVEINKFITSISSQQKSQNFSYTSASSQSFNINATNSLDVTNFTMQISGYSLDAENEFVYNDNLNISSRRNETLSYRTDSPLGMFDDFVVNNSGRWSINCITGTCPLSYTSVNGDASLAQQSSGSTGTSQLNYVDSAADIRNTTYIEMFKRVVTECGCAGCGSTGTSTATLQATDGTNTVSLFSQSLSCSGCSCSGRLDKTYNLSMRRTGEKTWDVCTNNSCTGSDLTALDYTQQIKFRWDFGWGQSGGGSAGGSFDLHNIKWGGIWLNHSAINGTYAPSGNYTVCDINKSKTNISSITLNAVTYIPANTKIDYYVSNTCNSSNPTFESATLGQSHIFETFGNRPGIRFSLNSSSNTSSPIVRSFSASVTSASGCNISVDVGNDNDVDFNFPICLNSTTSPRIVNVSSSEFNSYKSSSCSGLTCNYPVTITLGRAGIVSVDNISLTQKNNVPLSLANLTRVDILNSWNWTFNIFSGILNVYDLDIEYLGSKNFTLTLHGDSASPGNVSQVLQIKYSKFNVSLPKGIIAFNVFATSRIQRDLTPFGQNNATPIWNITNLAYDDDFDTYVRLNGSIPSCLNITYSNNTRKSDGIGLDAGLQRVITKTQKNAWNGIWSYVDLNNCTGRFIIPYTNFRTFCTTCVR